MGGRQRGQVGLAIGGQLEVDDPAVVGIGAAPQQAGPLGPVDQLDGTVVAQHQVLGDVADRRVTIVAPHGEEQLVLGGCQPGGAGLTLRPLLEPPQGVTEPQQLTEVVVGRGARVARRHIVPRYFMSCRVARSPASPTSGSPCSPRSSAPPPAARRGCWST